VIAGVAAHDWNEENGDEREHLHQLT